MLHRDLLNEYRAQKRAGRFEASRPPKAGESVKRLECLMLQLTDLILHGKAPAAYSPEQVPQSAPASYEDEVAAQRASLEALQRLTVADALEEEPEGASPEGTSSAQLSSMLPNKCILKGKPRCGGEKISVDLSCFCS